MGRLDDFLDQQGLSHSCVVCESKTIANTVLEYLDRLASGTTTCSINKLHIGLLVELGGPRSLTTVLRHVRSCLKRDPKTGHPLDRRPK